MNSLSFEQCFEAARLIAEKVQCASIAYLGVYGIPKGGMIPAAMVAYHLRIPLAEKPANEVLIVDDTVNTGRNVKSYLCEGFDLAVLQVHEQNLSKCKYHGIIINDFTEFPWERKEWGFLNQ